ncbi:Glucose 1-dehydrogenase [Aquicella siphonis]|uniref:Glucose 1-dehydrogenase n=1 Tax=Aquicella siphonis TaxID=254247 RepID=A0A5E4PJF6_9COXI|nr:SDR family oxidoreductase [Aquicella siphonis]VVC76481.1 Glucose 1-dehydrogenase [Aquicella siphonis]
MKKIAIVTGASRGIGAATARHLAEQGYAVCVNYHSAKDKADELVQSIRDKNGEAIAVKADMGSEADILQLFAAVDQEWGPLTALVNNAGTNGGICEVENITAECLHTVFATNVYGTFLACREAVKRMKAHGGAIVNVSSEAAKFGGNKLAHYAASKAAINTFTVGFAREVAPYGIRVNTVSPGVIDTEIHHASPPDRIANLLKTLPMGRMGSPEEVAEMIAWLLSEKASYVSGAVLPVTGSR